MRKEDALKELSEIRKNLAPEDVEKIQSLVSEGNGKIDIDAVTGGMSEKAKKGLYAAGILAAIAGTSAAAALATRNHYRNYAWNNSDDASYVAHIQGIHDGTKAAYKAVKNLGGDATRETILSALKRVKNEAKENAENA